MFANEYQGGAHVEVLSTQGQNPLAQWKISGPQKGVQKAYDKALKGYVFVSSGACRLALPKDERATLGLVQPLLLLQLEVGVGTPFSLEVGLSDASATRRRIILSSSFSELKCTPLHCQVPFTCLPRESWLNLVLPLADLAAVLFKVGGGAGGGGGGGAAAAAAAGAGPGGAAAAAAGGAALASMAAAGSSLSQAMAAGCKPSFRTLDSLQVAGTCRLRRICTLREMPQSVEAQDGGAVSPAASSRPWEFPAGLDHQTLLMDPRSLSLVGVNSGGSPTQTMTLGAGGGGLGVVGTSTGSSRRPANGSSATALPGVNENRRVSMSMALKNGGGAAAGSASGPPGGTSGEEDGVGGAAAATPTGIGASAVSSNHVSEAVTRGSSSGVSTPTSRGSSAVPTLPPAFGATPGPSHQAPGSAEHAPTPSRLGRSPSGGFSQLVNGGGSPPLHPGSASGPSSACGSGPLPSLDSTQSLGAVSASSGGGGGGGGGSGLKLPRVQANGSSGAAAAASAAAAAGASSPNGDDSNRGDSSPFGSRRALSAQTPPRQNGSATPPGSAGGTGAGAGCAAADTCGGGCAGGAAAAAAAGGKPPAAPWSGSSTSKRAQSGPARISTEALAQVRLGRASEEPEMAVEAGGLGDTVAPADTPTSPSLAPRAPRRTQNNSQIPPTISEHEASPAPTPATPSIPASNGGAGTPVAKSPARSPSRTRPQAGAAYASPPGPGGGGAAAAASSAAAAGALRSGGSGGVEPASPALPHLRHLRVEAAAAAAAREQPASPAAVAIGASNASNAFAQLNSVLTIRGGMEASIDFGAHSNLLDGSPGSSSILSSNLRVCSVTRHAHRYGNGGCGAAAGAGAAGGAACSPSTDSFSDSDGDGAPSPSAAGGGFSGVGAGAAGAATSTSVAGPAPNADTVKVPRTRTRAIPGGGAAGGGGGGGGGGAGKGTAAAVAADGANGRSPPTPAVVPSSPGLATRKAHAASGQASDVDTPTRVGRGTVMSAVSQNGRYSPANTPSRAAGGGGGGGRATPMAAGGGAGGGAGAGPGPSNLGPNGNGVRQRKEDGAVSIRPSATAGTLAATATAAAAAAGGGGAATGTSAGKSSAAASGGGGGCGNGGGASAPKQAGNGAASVCSSPARQRPAPSSATRGTTKPNGVVSGEAAADNRDRLPPLASGGGRGRNGTTAGGRGGSGAAAAAGGGRGNPAAGRGMRPKRPTTSNEVDVEESITLNAGLWGGFGVDEDDDMLGSRHFRTGMCGGSSGSDGEFGGGGGGTANATLTSTPSLQRGLGGGGGGGGGSSFVRRASRSSSPDAPRRNVSGAAADDLPSPPDHYVNASANGMLSPPIRRVDPSAVAAGVAATASQDIGPAFAGFPAPVGRRRSSVAGASAGGTANEGRTIAACHVLDSLLDEEALLAGHVRGLDHYDEWAKVDQRPTPPELMDQHRAFTPPVVPASKSLGVSFDAGRGGGGGGGGGRSGYRGGPQVLRVSAAAAAAGAVRGDGRGQGAVVAGGGEAMLDLVYDPVLNCYYDGTTGQYYELKT